MSDDHRFLEQTCQHANGARMCEAPAVAQVTFRAVEQTGVEIFVCRYHQWHMRRTKVPGFKTLVECDPDAPLLGPNEELRDE